VDKGQIDGQNNQLKGKGERKERSKDHGVQENPAAAVDGDEVSILFRASDFIIINRRFISSTRILR
jgi:hypothetical protein